MPPNAYVFKTASIGLMLAPAGSHWLPPHITYADAQAHACLQVLIGCLPVYSSIGVAAPVLLSVLRAVQGLGMGGEFGTAVSETAEGEEGGGMPLPGT